MSAPRFSELLAGGPTFRQQAALYRAGRYEELASNGDSAAWRSLLDSPPVPVWQVRLLLMDEAETDRTVKACELIDRSANPDKAIIAAVLRDSIVRNGEGCISDDPEKKPTPAMVRFAVFFVIEKLRVAGLSRDESIDLVSRVYRPRDTTITLSAQTIRGWYDKKHGAGYTGLKQLAELLVSDPGPIIDPFLVGYCRMIARNTQLIVRLNTHCVISAAERAGIKSIAQWLQRMAEAFHYLCFDEDDDCHAARVRRRLRAIDRDKVLATAMPLLIRQAGADRNVSRH
jgi:hypothetical protein